MDQATTIEPKLTIEWLNKLLMMAQWGHGELPVQFVRLFNAPDEYQRFLRQVREGNTNPADVTDQAVKTAREKLWEAIATWPALKELFGAGEDPFAGAPVGHLKLLAEVSDITTDPQRMVNSWNGTFLAVIEALRQSQELEAEPLIADGLNKFLTLLETDEAVAEMLHNLAEEPHWFVVMASLRDGRDYTRHEEPTVAQTLREWQAKLTTELRALLFKPGHLSRAPTKLIRMAWNNQQVFQEARDAIPPDRREQDLFEERRQVANEALLLFKQKAGVDYQEIEADLMVLATVARHYINVRKFAKLDGFVYTWPEIARLAMSNYPALEYVEDLLVNRKARPADTDLDSREARDLYELCARNDRLIRFMRLRPRFAEIDDDELRRYRPLAPVVITEATVQPPTDASRAASGSVDFPPPSPLPSPAPGPAKPFENSVLEITRKSAALPQDADVIEYEVSLRGPGYTVAGFKSQFAADKLLEQLRVAIGVGSDNELQSVLRDLFATSPTQAEARMTRGGSVLSSALLSGSMQERIRSLLWNKQPLRLVVKSMESEPHYIPWEWLPGLSPTQLLLNAPENSVVRQFVPPLQETPTPLMSSLRLMSIIPPAPVGRRFTSDITMRALQSIVASEPVEYRPLVRSEATLENITAQLELFKPQVVHFEGYLNALTTDVNGEAFEVYLGGHNQQTLLDTFAQLLRENGVELLVIGRNSAGPTYRNLGARATFFLNEKGPPAVIAPMRAIDDASATTFTTEFYRAFLQGNTLEAALYIARRKLASKGGDWSVFALFADPARLDHFQVLRESA